MNRVNNSSYRYIKTIGINWRHILVLLALLVVVAAVTVFAMVYDVEEDYDYYVYHYAPTYSYAYYHSNDMPHEYTPTYITEYENQYYEDYTYTQYEYYYDTTYRGDAEIISPRVITEVPVRLKSFLDVDPSIDLNTFPNDTLIWDYGIAMITVGNFFSFAVNQHPGHSLNRWMVMEGYYPNFSTGIPVAQISYPWFTSRPPTQSGFYQVGHFFPGYRVNYGVFAGFVRARFIVNEVQNTTYVNYDPTLYIENLFLYNLNADIFYDLHFAPVYLELQCGNFNFGEPGLTRIRTGIIEGHNTPTFYNPNTGAQIQFEIMPEAGLPVGTYIATIRATCETRGDIVDVLEIEPDVFGLQDVYEFTVEAYSVTFQLRGGFYANHDPSRLPTDDVVRIGPPGNMGSTFANPGEPLAPDLTPIPGLTHSGWKEVYIDGSLGSLILPGDVDGIFVYRDMTFRAIWEFKVEFIKTDMYIYIYPPDPSNTQDGAEFVLEREIATDVWAYVSSDISGPGGEVLLTGIFVDGEYAPFAIDSYRVREVASPSGFLPPVGYWRLHIHVDQSGITWSYQEEDGALPFVELQYIWYVGNIPITEWHFYKTDYTFTEYLGGATFVLLVYNGDMDNPNPQNVTQDNVGPANQGYMWTEVRVITNNIAGVAMQFPMMPGRIYRLIELVAPVSHRVPHGQWQIQVMGADQDNPGGTWLEISYIGDVPEIRRIGDAYYIANLPQIVLPMAGGPGTFIFTFMGMVLLIGAVAMFLFAKSFFGISSRCSNLC